MKGFYLRIHDVGMTWQRANYWTEDLYLHVSRLAPFDQITRDLQETVTRPHEIQSDEDNSSIGRMLSFRMLVIWLFVATRWQIFFEREAEGETLRSVNKPLRRRVIRPAAWGTNSTAGPSRHVAKRLWSELIYMGFLGADFNVHLGSLAFPLPQWSGQAPSY